LTGCFLIVPLAVARLHTDGCDILYEISPRMGVEGNFFMQSTQRQQALIVLDFG